MSVVAQADQVNTRSSALLAARARLNVVRMLEATPAGHVGGALSCIDAVAVLYSDFLNVAPDRIDDPIRDRFLLSAGHKALAQYAVLAEQGFFDKAILDTYGLANTALGGHPDMHKLPGIEGNTGALGHGLGLGVGMALGLRETDAHVYVVMGDGELAEGSNWEGAAMAAHYGVDNLTALVDVNGMQISGTTAEVMNMEQIGAKFEAFGWNVTEIGGHDHEVLHRVLSEEPKPGVPTAIILRTIKGCGISEIAGTVGSHYWKPNAEQLAVARTEIEEAIAVLESAEEK
ncbi:transketolase [Flaviflexus massiliensis]|uniref:transketolase n=1 Tax=Flaviflexus massiliensis TaxID=1522309 RepID=UPI0006D54F8D|nr:transketolase [Flaviflexus massiliensis]